MTSKYRAGYDTLALADFTLTHHDTTLKRH